MRSKSKISQDWWDYTTLDPEILLDAARLPAEDLSGLARVGFDVRPQTTDHSPQSTDPLC